MADVHPKVTQKQEQLENEWVKNMRRVTQPHIVSFDHAIAYDLNRMIKHLPTWRLSHAAPEEPGGLKHAEVSVVQINISKPEMPQRPGIKLYPSQCREGQLNYSGKCEIEVEVKVLQDQNSREGHAYRVTVDGGYLPIMVMSSLCHLRHMSKEELAEHGEEIFEAGGYFITGGSERVVRLLNAPKRNYVCVCVRCVILLFYFVCFVRLYYQYLTLSYFNSFFSL